jgi:adenine phosphoribosyltransferase
MNRLQFRKQFKVLGPAVLPVIHVQDIQQTLRNIQTAVNEGAQGVFLINHDFAVEQFLPIIREARSAFPALWLGVNFLGVTGREAFPILGMLQREGCDVDAYWADDARIDESLDLNGQAEADEILRVKEQSGWQGLYFGGTAFKKQREVSSADYATAASLAAEKMDVVTTSGVATGKKADLSKVQLFREAMHDHPLALASGITPNNVDRYAKDVDAVLVATGINFSGDFYNIDKLKLRQLIHNCRQSAIDAEIPVNAQNDRESRWYLAKMAPRSRGDKYAWLDPSSAYINASSFHAMLDDLLAPFSPDEVDVVAGFDAAGFVLGAAMADRLGKGFLTIRKGGKIPVEFDVVDMSNYSGQTQHMEMRKPAFAPGTRVLLVDQWIETGGTMSAGISLVERQGGEIAGIAAVCIEDTEASREMRVKYKLSSCVVPGSAIQEQCDRQTLDSFATFSPEDCFPEIGKES